MKEDSHQDSGRRSLKEIPEEGGVSRRSLQEELKGDI
jgi:hypothetical protein